MPPKSSATNQSTKPKGPTKEELEAIQQYLDKKPDFDKLIREAKSNLQQASPPQKSETDYDRQLQATVTELVEEKQKRIESSKTTDINMPVLPNEEEAGSNLTDQVAKESKDSTASTHPLHDEGKAKASVQDHQANPGPVIAENLGDKASKEELKKRAEELNR